MNQSKMKQSCLDGDYVNKWTMAIFSLMLMMAASITLAIIFPYQGSDPYQRTTSDDDSETVVVVVPSTTEDGETVVVDNVEIITEEEDSNNDVLMQKDIVPNSEEEMSQPSVNEELSSSNQQDVNHVEQMMMEGLFGPITTTADAINDSNSSCQSKLQEADVNMDNIINSAEYIHFLIDNPIISQPLTSTQFEDSAHFEELPAENQVVFTHLAVPRTGGDGEAMVGIPIGTVDEMQKVCLYVSNRGISAVGQFDWDKMPSSP